MQSQGAQRGAHAAENALAFVLFPQRGVRVGGRPAQALRHRASSLGRLAVRPLPHGVLEHPQRRGAGNIAVRMPAHAVGHRGPTVLLAPKRGVLIGGPSLAHVGRAGHAADAVLRQRHHLAKRTRPVAHIQANPSGTVHDERRRARQRQVAVRVPLKQLLIGRQVAVGHQNVVGPLSMHIGQILVPIGPATSSNPMPERLDGAVRHFVAAGVDEGKNAVDRGLAPQPTQFAVFGVETGTGIFPLEPMVFEAPKTQGILPAGECAQNIAAAQGSHIHQVQVRRIVHEHGIDEWTRAEVVLIPTVAAERRFWKRHAFRDLELVGRIQARRQPTHQIRQQRQQTGAAFPFGQPPVGLAIPPRRTLRNLHGPQRAAKPQLLAQHAVLQRAVRPAGEDDRATG